MLDGKGYNEKAAQKKIFAALIKEERVTFAPMLGDPGRIAVTSDGYVGYVFDLDTITINPARLALNQRLADYFSFYQDDKTVASSTVARIIDERAGIATRFVSGCGTVHTWIRDALIKGVFDPCVAHFEASDNRGRVLVRTNGGRVCGIVMPTTVSSEDANCEPRPLKAGEIE